MGTVTSALEPSSKLDYNIIVLGAGLTDTASLFSNVCQRTTPQSFQTYFPPGTSKLPQLPHDKPFKLRLSFFHKSLAQTKEIEKLRDLQIGAHAVIICCDLSKTDSLNEIKKIFQLLPKRICPRVKKYCIHTKSRLTLNLGSMEMEVEMETIQNSE